MMGLFEPAWVIARRDFVASVFSRFFVLFLLAPLVLFAFMGFFVYATEAQDRIASQPVVAVVADTATADALNATRARLVAGTSELAFPILRNVAPAENVAVQAQHLLADEAGGYSAVLSGTLQQPVLTAPLKADEFVGRRLQLVVDEARRSAALDRAGAAPPTAAIERVVTAQAVGNLQLLRRTVAQGAQSLIFAVTLMLATLLLSTLVEEKSNKIIEVLAAAVPLDAIFLGKLLAMLGISLVGLALWSVMAMLGITFFYQLFQNWITLPEVTPAVGWPIFVVLLLLYYTMNFMLLGALFLGIGGQATNIREIQTISMPVTLLQLMVLLLAMTAIGGNGGALALTACIFPFSSPMAMIATAAESPTLWPHLVALAWQAIWVVLIIRVSSRLFRMTVLKSTAGGSFFSFLKIGKASA
ncbi:MAG: type transport system permease protein [Sphingomonadales bacterium]|jgi:ABC-2 type transport system permease protein|nr:type transport system permease protein [Sphingomonadales bacterium]MEA3044398.1 type transport system permease protein [Sphingomonadales bacterium]